MAASARSRDEAHSLAQRQMLDEIEQLQGAEGEAAEAASNSMVWFQLVIANQITFDVILIILLAIN